MDQTLPTTLADSMKQCKSPALTSSLPVFRNHARGGASARLVLAVVAGILALSTLAVQTASADPVDEPYWLASQSHTTSTLFSVPTNNRGNMGHCRPKVYNGYVYGLYFRDPDTRTMIYKAALDGSSFVSAPLTATASGAGAVANPANDNHYDFEVTVDRVGYIHVTGAMHTGPRHHWYSTNPEDVSAFRFSQASGEELIPGDNVTFASFMTDRHGQLFWHSDQGDGALISYDETTRLWTALGAPNPKQGGISFAWEDNALYDDETTAGGMGAMMNRMAADSNGRLHFGISLLNKTFHGPHQDFAATDILYAYSDDGGKTVHKSDGTPITFPIRAEAGPNQGEVLLTEQDAPRAEWLSKFLNISVDKADRPMIKALSFTTGSHLFRLESGQWVDYQNYSPGGDPSTDPRGVVVGITADGDFKRSWGPTGGKNIDTVAFSVAVEGYDQDYYRDTGELVWASLSGSSDTNLTLTLHRTVFTPVEKVIGVDLQASNTTRGTQAGDVAGGFYTGLTSGAWNAFAGPAGPPVSSATSPALVPMDGSGTKNPVTVKIGGGAGESFSFQDWGDFGALQGDGIALSKTNPPVSIKISGLIPGNQYDLALFASTLYLPNVTFNGITRKADGVFKAVPAAVDGTILGSFSCSGTAANARLAGLQIQGMFVDLPTNDVAFKATDDAHVNQSDGTGNNGTATALKVKAPVGGTGEMGAYVKFDVSTVDPATITHATLKVYSQTVAANIRVYQADNTTWSQDTITWNNQPGLKSPSQLLSQAVAAPNSWVSFDVTSVVRANDGQCSFVLRSDSTTQQQFTSLEATGTKAPVLTITRDTSIAYTTWATTHAPTGRAADDFDGNGVANGLEFILGGTTNNNALGKLPQVSSAGGNMNFTFIRDQASINDVTTIDIQGGTNLTDWPLSYRVPATALANNPGLTVIKNSPAAGKDTVTLTLPVTPGVNTFFRLKVTP